MPQIDNQSFATSFAQLAHSMLDQKIPAIIPKMLGFQVIDKSDDDSRGVGFFAFELSGQLCYVPAFFLRGEIKGLDMIYVKDKDLFFPLDEDWVQFIETKKINSLGEAVNTQEANKFLTQPDFINAPAFGFNSKIATAKLPKHMLGGLDMFLKLLDVNKSNRYTKTASLIDGLKKTSPIAGYTFLKNVRDNLKLASFIITNYKDDELVEAIRDVSTLKLAHPILDLTTPKLEFVDYNYYERNRPELSYHQKEAVLKGETVVIDRRDQTKLAEVIQKEVNYYDSPSEAGLYEVMWRDGKFRDALVLNMFTLGSGRTGGQKIVWRDGIKAPFVCRSKDIVARRIGDRTKKEHMDAIKNMGSDPKSIKKGQTILLIDLYGNCVGPCRIDEVNSDESGNLYTLVSYCPYNLQKPMNPLPAERDNIRSGPGGYGYRKYFDTYAYNPDCASDDLTTHENPLYVDSSGARGPYMREIVITDKHVDGIVNNSRRTVCSSDMCVVIRLDKDSGPFYSNGSEPAISSGDLRKKEEKVDESLETQLATPFDLENGLRKTASLDRVKIYYNNIATRYQISSDRINSQDLGKIAALKKLIVDFSMKEIDAQDLLRQAEAKGVTRFTLHKKAFIQPPISNGYDPNAGAMTVSPQQMQEVFPTQAPSPYLTPDPNMGSGAIQMMEQAAATGRKDVFDSAALGALININNVSEVINSFMPDLITGLDRLARLLFILYWHYEDFEERYEKQELVNFEDNLLNVLKNLGDLVIDLQRRAIVDNPIASGFSLL